MTPYVVQRGFTYLETRGPCGYPYWRRTIEEATIMSHQKASWCAAAHGGQAIPAEVRVFAPEQAPVETAPTTQPAGVPLPSLGLFAGGYTYVEEQ